MNIFEQATRTKTRFETGKGLLTVEDLWDLPLAALDKLAVGYSKAIKDAPTESFVHKTVRLDNGLQLHFELVKHIIDTKLAEADAAKTAREARDRKVRILEIIDRKREKNLEELPLDELEKMLVEA